ncbi:MAG: amidohydrolase family protein [Bryobacteraceae bacterium]|nr:amidohydrolase family protein [Bryobacteraceae bacterium]
MRLTCFLLLSSAVWAANVDLLVTARYVVTMDATRRVIENGALAIQGTQIVDAGPAADLLKRHTAKQRLDRPRAILAPGLINTHGHAPMVLFRGIADDLNLQDWLEKFIFPAEARNVTADFVRWGTRLALWEMIRSGTTTYADMYYFEEVIADETRKAGLRGVLGQSIIRFPVPDAKTPAEGLARTERFLQQFKNDPLIVAAVAPHAPYTNDDATLKACRSLANKYGAPLLIHLSETKKENDDSLKEFRMTPAARLSKLGIFDGPTLAAHGVWLTDSDLKLLAAKGVGVAHNPSSNMKLASGVAPVLKMRAAGIAVGLGTDGPAGSNNDLNLFEEMDLAAKLQKVSTGDPRSLSAEQTFAMATIEGARALNLAAKTGSLEKGKAADWIAIDLSEAHALPLFNVYSQLVYALKASDVRDVMVNGRMLLRDRQMLTLDTASIAAKAAAYQVSILASLKK